MVEKYSVWVKRKQEKAEQRRNKDRLSEYQNVEVWWLFQKKEHKYQAVIPLITFCVCWCVLC